MREVLRIRTTFVLLPLVLLMVPPAGAMSVPHSSPYSTLPNESDPTPNAPNAVRAVYSTRILDDLQGFELGVDLLIFELEIPPAGGRSAAELRTASVPLRELFETSVKDRILAEARHILPDARISLETIQFDYAATDLDEDPYEPGLHVVANLRALFTPQFFGLPDTFGTPPAEIARAFLYSGGVYEMSRQVRVAPGFDESYVVSAPEFIELHTSNANVVRLLEFRENNFAGTSPSPVNLDFGIRLRSGTVPQKVLDGPLVKAVFVVDDVTPAWKQLVPFLNGDYLGNLDLRIEVNSLDTRLFARNPLPPALRLEQISGDLLRIAIREGLVNQDDVSAFFQDLIVRSLQEGFGDDITVEMDWPALDQSLNQPVGGSDGRTINPVVVQATALLPFESNKMFVSSSVGRLVGMTLGTTGNFELANNGVWNTDYTVAYPEGVQVQVKDSLGRIEDLDWGAREGFHIYLGKGESTQVHVEGRSKFDLLVFLAGFLEALLLGLAVWGVSRKIQFQRLHKARPWAI